MNQRLTITPISPPGGARHDHMLRRFSHHVDLLLDLRSWAADRSAAVALVRHVCRELDTPAPEVTFHRGRGLHTGYAQAPRHRAVQIFGEHRVRSWEQEKRRRWPSAGMVRLGDPTALGTVAHELGHHLVHHHEPLDTPAHGRRWVSWFDVAADSIAALLSSVRKET